MKNLLITVSLVAAFASPALAETSTATIQDHYKTVIEQKPYNVEVCKKVQVPYGNQKEFDAGSAIIGGLIGGVIGNQIGKGGGKEAATGIGAMTGAIIAGSKDGGPKGYTTQTQCQIETRYEETTREVYSHSTVTFWSNNQKRTLTFQK